ncbi:PLP-dependent aminotransferase family protein [Gorillibacterium sp. CAU 1737]|uniref:aminotransferase-like domain-containing protein n=1 Tax=Gorillibacterium sp. CAU 1737 TaxID=3140362 RepID=UPI0032600AFD
MRRYEVILSDLERRLKEGAYQVTKKLPSVREAALTYECSVSTILRAYAELERRHLIYSVPQSGHYAVSVPDSEQRDSEKEKVDFSSASPDPEVFPYLDFQHCLNKAIDTYKHQLFTYGATQGLDKLRYTLVSHLANDQVFAKPSQLVVTSGIHPVLEVLSRMPFPNGREAILVESPTYDLFLRVLETEGLPVLTIRRTVDGIDLDELEQHFKSGVVKFFYTMSRFHNPLGTSFHRDTCRAIAALASRYDVYVVEDDYVADLGEAGGFQPIHSYDSTGHVVYVKSFSKIVFPGLRLGAAVLPEKLRDTFLQRKSADASLLSQAALEIYIKNGMYERHKRTMMSQYASRMTLLVEALREEMRGEGGSWNVPDMQAGIYLPLLLPQTVNLERLMKKLTLRNVLVTSGKAFYHQEARERDKLIRLSIARARPDQIRGGVGVLLEEVKRELRWPV